MDEIVKKSDLYEAERMKKDADGLLREMLG
jgi:hypothetical protein